METHSPRSAVTCTLRCLDNPEFDKSLVFVLLMKDLKRMLRSLVEGVVSFLLSKHDSSDYREDSQLGRISESTADYCLNYTSIRTVFISAGLSFTRRAILLVGHYTVLSRMHTSAHAQRRTLVRM